MVDSTAFGELTSTQAAVLEQLDSYRVEYLVIGGFAVRHYGYERPTADLDILVVPDKDNIDRLQQALRQMGGKNLEDLAEHFQKPRPMVKIWDVEFFAFIPGLDTAQLKANADRLTVALPNKYSASVLVISRNDLLAAKRLAAEDAARGDKQAADLLDLKMLRDL